MIGRTNSGSGSGGLSIKNAVIHVNAELNSTVELKKDDILVATILPAKALPNIDGTTADYYYSVKANNYGTWTAVATKDSFTVSGNITVDTIKQYDIILGYSVYAVKDSATKITPTITGTGTIPTWTSAPAKLSQGDSTSDRRCNFSGMRNNQTQVVLVSGNTATVGGYMALWIYVQDTAGGNVLASKQIKASSDSSSRSYPNQTFTLDISSITRENYPTLSIALRTQRGAGSGGVNFQVVQFYIE